MKINMKIKKEGKTKVNICGECKIKLYCLNLTKVQFLEYTY